MLNTVSLAENWHSTEVTEDKLSSILMDTKSIC